MHGAGAAVRRPLIDIISRGTKDREENGGRKSRGERERRVTWGRAPGSGVARVGMHPRFFSYIDWP